MYNFRCPHLPKCVFVVFVILWDIFKILCLLSYKWWSIRLQMSNGYFNPRVAHGHPVVIEWSYAAFKCWLVPPIPWNDTPNCLQTQHFNFFGKIWFCLFIMSIRFEKYSVGYGEYKCSISLRYLTVWWLNSIALNLFSVNNLINYSGSDFPTVASYLSASHPRTLHPGVISSIVTFSYWQLLRHQIDYFYST